MIIAANSINLRIASEKEESIGRTLIDNGNSTPGKLFTSQPKYILVSEEAFDGCLSFYLGFKNENNEIESCGWIGKI